MALTGKGKPAKKKTKSAKKLSPEMHMMPGEKMPMKNSTMPSMMSQERELKTRYPSMFQKATGKRR